MIYYFNKTKELCMKGDHYARLKGNTSCKGNGANGLLVFKSTFKNYFSYDWLIIVRRHMIIYNTVLSINL